MGQARQRRTETTHECPYPGCEVHVEDSVLACRKHWFVLPKGLRQEIYDTVQVGQTAATMSDDYRLSLDHCMEFWKAHKARAA